MANLFSSEDRALLKKPHVGHGYFVALEHPTLGTLRFHNGLGRVSAGGHEWRGVSSPDGRQMVGIDTIMDQRFGQAAAVTIVISGANAAFMSEMRTTARALEGAAASVFLGVFDQETAALLMFRSVFPGLVSAPSLLWEGIARRTIVVTIESEDQAKNFTPTGKWSPAGIRARHGQYVKGLDFMGVDIKEVRK